MSGRLPRSRQQRGELDAAGPAALADGAAALTARRQRTAALPCLASVPVPLMALMALLALMTLMGFCRRYAA